MRSTTLRTDRASWMSVMWALAVACILACTFACISPVNAYAAEGNGAKASASAPVLVAAQADTSATTTVQAAASEPVVSKASVKARANVAYVGWKDWVTSGATAGTKTYNGLRAFKLKLAGLGKDLKGHINYRAYDTGKGWGATKVDGKSTGRTSVPVQAVKVWLSGDVSKHYDVLYRVYIKGKGWQPWVKNKTKAGITKKGVYLSAVQVKLSPKTEEAVGKSISAVGVRYETRIKTSGWQAWTGDGKVAGKTTKQITLDGFVLKLDPGSLKGSVTYRAYIDGDEWGQGWKTNGKTAGTKGDQMEALQIKLTGAIANAYDIYYCAYVRGYGWLDWAKNGETAGSTGRSLPLGAVRVKLVKKGSAAPKSLATYVKPGNLTAAVTRATTVNQLAKTLNGIDISSWQAGIKVANVDADFVIVKATEGTTYKNPYFKQWASETILSGKLLGAYHFVRTGNAVKQADYFVKTVGTYVGKCVLVLDWENRYDDAATKQGVAWAKKFLDRVYAKTGVRPLIYMSKNPTRESNWKSVAKNYKLWVAQYKNYAKTGYQANPWTDSYSYGAWKAPTIFQYTSTGRISGYGADLDLDIFYGTANDWKALAKSNK